MGRSDTAKVLVATLFGSMDTNALVPVLALYAASPAIGADLLQVGVIIGIYSAVHAPANLLMGRLADRIGRKLPLNVGLLWDAVSLALYAVAASPLQLALVRVGHGLGGALVGPSTMSLVADTAPPDRKGRAMALYGMSIALAVVVGFGIAGPLARLSYTVLFGVLAAGLLVGFLVSLTIREPPRVRAERRGDVRGLLRYLRRPEPAAGYAAIFSLYFLLGAFVALVPIHLQDELGYGPLEVGLSFTVFALLSLVLHYPAGILADRRGPATPAMIGLAAVAAAMAVIPLARSVGTIALTMALFGVGHGFVFPAASSLVSRHAPPDRVGVATGLFYAVLVAGVAVGAPAMAAVADASTAAFGIWVASWFAFIGIPLVVRALVAPSAGTSPAPGRTPAPAEEPADP